MKNGSDLEIHIYVAGPLYGSGHLDENIKAALTVADILSSAGEQSVVPFVPHLYTFWHFRSEKPEETWLRLDKAWLRKCDGIVRIAGTSPGSTLEEGWAAEWDMPLLHLPPVSFIRTLDADSGYHHPELGSKMRDWVKAEFQK